MNRFFLVIFVLLIIIPVIAYIVITNYSFENNTRESFEQQRANILNKNKEKIKEQLVKLKQAQDSRNSELIKKEEEKLETMLTGRTKKMYKASRSAIHPVEFYGVIKDQNKIPIIGAKVKYTIGNSYLSIGTGSNVVDTDSAGVFKAIGNGASIAINSISHPNITNVKYTNSDGMESSRLFLNDWSAYTINNPYRIHVWTQKNYEYVISGSRNKRFTSDGEINVISIDETRNALVVRKAASTKRNINDLFEVICERDEWTIEENGSWAFKIKPVGGAMQKTEDLYLNQAPIGGYEIPEIIYIMQSGSEKYKNSLHLREKYYMYMHNKRIYGSLIINSIYPYSRKKEYCAINIDYKFNTNNSRSLAIRDNPLN